MSLVFANPTDEATYRLAYWTVRELLAEGPAASAAWAGVASAQAHMLLLLEPERRAERSDFVEAVFEDAVKDPRGAPPLGRD